MAAGAEVNRDSDAYNRAYTKVIEWRKNWFLERWEGVPEKDKTSLSYRRRREFSQANRED